MSPRIVSVVGATSTQGLAVLRSLLKDGTFSPRAIARDPSSASAQKVKDLGPGIELVQGDPNDKASLLRALKGSEAVFALTIPVFTPDSPSEFEQGKNLVDASKEAGVKFFVWTSLPSIAKISNGKYKACTHYDTKADIQDYLTASGLPHASLHLGGFLENYWKFGLLKPNPDGQPGFSMSITSYTDTDKQAFTWVEREVPAVTLALLRAYLDEGKEGVQGKIYPIVNETIPYAELARRTGEVLGVPVTFHTAPPTGMPPLDEMYLAHAEFSGLYTATPVPNPDLVALGVKLGTIDEFLQQEVVPRFGKK